MTVLTDTQVVTASGGLVELGYVEIASSVTVTSSTAGSGTEIIAPLTVVCDGSPVLVEFFCGQISTPNTSGAQTYTTLNQDGVEKVRYWGFASAPAATYDDKPQHLSYRTTPSAGSHTFGVKAFNSAPSLSAFYKAQNTTIGVSPAFLRVSKIVQATQWPAVTTGTIICTSSTRPASPFAGQQIYETDTSKSLIYNGTAWVSPQAQTVPPMCRAKVTGSVTVADATDTVVAFGAEDFDTNAMHDTATNNSRITFQTAGVYLVVGVINYTAGIDADHAPFIRKGGSTELARISGGTANQNGGATISVIAEFAVSEYVELVAYQNNSANTARTLGSSTSLTATFQGKTA